MVCGDDLRMPFIVTEPCIQCKYTDCVTVCPMDCFVQGPNFVVIDPAGCIDCSICVPQCPVNAIVNAAEASAEQAPYIALNAQLAQNPAWTPITRAQAPLPDHEEWRNVGAKRHLLVTAA